MKAAIFSKSVFFMLAATIGYGTSLAKAGGGSVEQFQSVLKQDAAQKYEISEGKDLKGRPILTVVQISSSKKIPDEKYTVTFYGCEADGMKCKSLRLELSSSEGGATEKCIAHWTDAYRFGRLYKSRLGNLNLDMTQIIDSEKNIGLLKRTIEIWGAMRVEFKKLIQPGGLCQSGRASLQNPSTPSVSDSITTESL